MNAGLILIQGGTQGPGYSAKETQFDLYERGIYPYILAGILTWFESN